MIAAKPLFVPLKSEWFRAFACGVKTVEYRRYGRGWNERTCYPGRPVTLSHGYSGARIPARVVDVDLVYAADVPRATELYAADDVLIAIRLDLRRGGKAGV